MSAENETARSYILFELVGTAYVVPSEVVQQMEMVEQVTPVPNAPPFLDGVVFVRGQVVPVVNLRARFGFSRVALDLKSRLIVVSHSGRTIGLLVDSAREFISLAPAQISPTPEGVTNLNGRYLAGIAHVNERLILVLDIAQLMQFDDGLTIAPTN